MEKRVENNENNISSKDIINWIIAIVGILISLFSANFFTNDKENGIFLKVFFVSLITSLSASFIWLKLFSDKKNNKLVSRLIKEVEAKKDLERQNEKLQESLELKQTLLSHAEKDKEELSQENKKLKNEKNQLRVVLSSCGVLQTDVGIDKNISLHEWERKPGIKEKIEEITQKEHKKWLESENDVFNLSKQLEEKGVPWYEQRFGDKRLKRKVIAYIENYWRNGSHIKADTNNEIEGKTIEEILTKHWKEHLQSKKGKDIIEEGRRLQKIIDDFTSGHLRKIN